jgi:hypothetical protein
VLFFAFAQLGACFTVIGMRGDGLEACRDIIDLTQMGHMASDSMDKLWCLLKVLWDCKLKVHRILEMQLHELLDVIEYATDS